MFGSAELHPKEDLQLDPFILNEVIAVAVFKRRSDVLLEQCDEANVVLQLKALTA